MNKKAAILFVHGMGDQDRDFDQSLKKHLYQELEKLGITQEEVPWRTAFWADVTKKPQNDYLKQIEDIDLDMRWLRNIIIRFLGDATAYANPNGEIYKQINNKVYQAVSALYEDVNRKDVPLIILGHSLGCHILSNCIYDMQKNPIEGISAFEGFNTLSGIMTFGCNIPLFALAHIDTYLPIQFPPKQLPTHLKPLAKWCNFYDKDDVLAYPLKPIKSLNFVEDIEIKGSGLVGKTPLAHEFYWDDKELNRPIAKFIKTVIDSNEK